MYSLIYTLRHTFRKYQLISSHRALNRPKIDISHKISRTWSVPRISKTVFTLWVTVLGRWVTISLDPIEVKIYPEIYGKNHKSLNSLVPYWSRWKESGTVIIDYEHWFIPAGYHICERTGLDHSTILLSCTNLNEFASRFVGCMPQWIVQLWAPISSNLNRFSTLIACFV